MRMRKIVVVLLVALVFFYCLLGIHWNPGDSALAGILTFLTFSYLEPALA